ncbi:hypothetical protein KM043_014199 [Ampulex compressa]|nr:hypothetical protein KM043_014199 [Ampulex compressa]
MLKVHGNDNAKKIVEARVLKKLCQNGYNLNIVNNYGENLLHISAANGCFNITKEILEKGQHGHIINRKNKFGWTPLMQAIRSGDINTVRLLLQNNSDINQSTFLGMSVLSLAAAISDEMFETVYSFCPTALLHTVNDDITPLCIAAMKNDKDLFFKLLSRGLEVSKANEYTHIMMRCSSVPEIKKLAREHLDIEDYWNYVEDNIELEIDKNKKKHDAFVAVYNNNGNSTNDSENLNSICSIPTFVLDTVTSKDITIAKRRLYAKPINLNLLYNDMGMEKESLISPTLAYNQEQTFPISPNVSFIRKNSINSVSQKEYLIHESIAKSSPMDQYVDQSCRTPLQRTLSIRPPDLNIKDMQDDLNSTLGFTPEFSPIRSPHVPPDINDENVFGENTPTPPHCRTPPRGMTLNTQQAKMVILLKHLGLHRYISMFLEQEVDIDLFMTLTNDDLIEIGIKNDMERKAILSVSAEYNRIEC